MERTYKAAILTVSDGVFHGTRTDDSGRSLAELLRGAGFAIAGTEVVADEVPEITAAIQRLAALADLVVTTGGTGFGPRDVTPEATRPIMTREAPGLAETMRAVGRLSSPMAIISRGLTGVVGTTLVLNLPGSPKGAVENLNTVMGVIPHALQLLGGDTQHTTAQTALPGPGEAAGAGPPVVSAGASVARAGARSAPAGPLAASTRTAAGVSAVAGISGSAAGAGGAVAGHEHGAHEHEHGPGGTTGTEASGAAAGHDHGAHEHEHGPGGTTGTEASGAAAGHEHGAHEHEHGPGGTTGTEASGAAAGHDHGAHEHEHGPGGTTGTEASGAAAGHEHGAHEHEHGPGGTTGTEASGAAAGHDHGAELAATGSAPAAEAPRSGDLGVGPSDVTLDLARHLAEGREVLLATAVRTDGTPPCQIGQKLLLGAGGPLSGTLGCSEFDVSAAADTAEVLAGGRPVLKTYHHDLGTVEVYLEPYRHRPELVVLAATPIALWLLRWGRDLGYVTVLVEFRESWITDEHRGAASVVVDNMVALRTVGGGSGEMEIVATDHDAPDVSAQIAALLPAKPRFIGIMGSARHTGHHLAALQAMGVPDADVGRIQSPVGLNLGAKTPPEIALSILGGLMAARTGRPGGWIDTRSSL